MTKTVLSQSKKKQDNIHRTPCPFCKELIVAGAKKCRFCKEDLIKSGKIAEQKQNFFTRKVAPSGPYTFWVLSMVAFLIAISQLSGDPNSRWITVMFVAVAIGFIAFLALIASIPRSKGKYGIITLLTFILFFGVLFNYDTIATAFGLDPTFSKSNVGNTNTTLEPATNTTSTPTPTPTPTKRLTQEKNVNSVQTNKVQCIGPDGKQFDTSMEECKNLNEKWGKPVNYILDCNIHPDCGGGVVRMSKSQCESPCSGLDVKTNTNQANTNQNTTPKSGANFFCYDNVYNYSYYTSSGEQCNLDNLVSLCVNGAKIAYDHCMDICLNDQNNRSSDCIYNYTDSRQKDCLDAAHVVFQQCNDACGDVRQKDSAKCY